MAAVVDQRQRRVPVSRSRLARAVDRALAAVGRPAGVVEIAVVDDAEMRRLNAAHRGIGRRTDVLAFPLEAPDAGPLVGQLVISADAAARQARRLRVPLALELDLLATHGTLHLVGYDDRDPVEADLMHRREREILGATPARLWRGLLPSQAVPTNARRSEDARTPIFDSRRTRSAPASTSRSPSIAERSRRPSRSGHPRFTPVSPRSLP
jgi:probable rRNA maturation factor